MKTFAFLCLAAAALLPVGCVYGPVTRARIRESEPPLAVDEIVRMSKAGISDAIILEKLALSGIAARPSVDQVVALKKEGLSDALIQAMVAARLGTPQPVLTEAYYPYDYYGWRADPYWYGWPCVSWWWWCRPYGYWHHPAPAVRRYRVVP